MARVLTAYLPPSAIFMGIALHEAAAAFMFMFMSNADMWRKPIFVTCGLALLMLLANVLLDVAIIDWDISPYPVPATWHPTLTIAAFVANLATAVLVLSLFMMRLRLVHRGSSPTFWLLAFMCAATLCFLVSANVVAIMTNLEVIQGKIPTFTKSSLSDLSTALFAISHALEGLFSALSSIAFLWEIGSGLGFSSADFATKVLFEHDGMRFVVIFCLNITIAVMALHAYCFGFTYVTFTAFYMPALNYAIEIHTFLITSYVSTRNILQSARSASASNGQSSSHRLAVSPTPQPQWQQPQQSWQQPQQYGGRHQWQQPPNGGDSHKPTYLYGQ
ncbi:hypothetical protein HK105_204352 [Polyrhizophydium stewartii]|uniref:Transmembrane protein n=1 Tax=Polyrhizophydium stewartii TaxID=2732419 RepID=A0ABR4N9Y0_9FUNG